MPRPLPGLLLVLATVLAFLPALGAGFVYDDHDYLFRNPGLAAGLTPAAARAAFTSFHSANWHPLTWLSHALDLTLFGASPAGHHAVNLALHAANALLLFLLLTRATAAPLTAFFAAALFALHPQRVEAVAWVAERKELLATAFTLLAIAAWASWTAGGRRGRYHLALGLYAAALMAKPMPVTLPLLLLCLDLWPLGRIEGRAAAGGTRFAGIPAALLLEKLPFLALAAGSAAMTVVAQRSFGAVQPLALLPLPERLANAAVAACAYLLRAVWPAGLAVFYPRAAGGVPALQAVGAPLLLCAATAGALALRRRMPWVTAGWCWYLVALLPVAGIVQVGDQAMADRYTYLPLLGPAVALCWTLRRAAEARPAARLIPAVAVATLLALGALSWRQCGFWRDDLTLFGRAAAAVPRNWYAENALGATLAEQERHDEAEAHFLRALEYKPDYSQAAYHLGNSRLARGRCPGAAEAFRRAVALAPGHADAWNNLGNALSCQQRFEEALGPYARSTTLAPGNPAAWVNYGTALRRAGRTDEGLAALRRAVAIAPGMAVARHNLALALLSAGDRRGAADEARALERIDPALAAGIRRYLAER